MKFSLFDLKDQLSIINKSDSKLALIGNLEIWYHYVFISYILFVLIHFKALSSIIYMH